ncbi:uncharacterized protein PV09_02733 [Verruconis gallopava]|uniref:Uncharacterized protein n=1 Tax=Verruconis gallopava TaxID=253628 RepID=A0A0D1XU04_9PEZI|nr:uncharacterized protein PV09_02733 [Verruconis gallopava]KIW06261.1 hypothetical protein PV09_02733 [Verruconis gallopava]
MSGTMTTASASEKTWLVVGASRGIGHELVRQLLNNGNRVLATVRGSESVHELWGNDQATEANCQLLQCDMLDGKSINQFITDLQHTGTKRIDYVVLNAGVLKYPNRATEISYEDLVFHLNTNTVGPIITARKLLQSGVSIGTIAFMSSDSGSSTEFRDFEDGFAAYGASKAALNHMLRHMAAELKRKGAETVILALHPGEVATDMANIDLGWEVEGQMTAEQSVSALLEVIPSKTPDQSGTFWTWENKPYPW